MTQDHKSVLTPLIVYNTHVLANLYTFKYTSTSLAVSVT